MRRETYPVRFLYGTAPGRFLLKMLVNPAVSRGAGVFLNSRFSGWLVPIFIRRHHIDMRGFEKKSYRSFNEFFTRKRISDKTDSAPEHLISPCDGWLSVYPVDEGQLYRVKNVDYRLWDLLRDYSLAKRFAGGLCLIFRLTPEDYHRYCYICEGVRTASRKIPGKLHCVRPIACASVPVFVQNSREYTVIRTERWGEVVQMEVGALLVGRISNHPTGRRVERGQEKGYFEFGGSTIIVLTQKGRVRIAEEILKEQRRGRETRVRMGEGIGTLCALP